MTKKTPEGTVKTYTTITTNTIPDPGLPEEPAAPPNHSRFFGSMLSALEKRRKAINNMHWSMRGVGAGVTPDSRHDRKSQCDKAQGNYPKKEPASHLRRMRRKLASDLVQELEAGGRNRSLVHRTFYKAWRLHASGYVYREGMITQKEDNRKSKNPWPSW
ncbi:hypothetical protein GGTG_06895 [Gaeumannomyces tritici R3-111a-1]|uniref:Uncharacterized protein n=1 Tax=Gaeumannomyces tritici (strain R3-111a-1) TaxID=644352 RepID=J3P048_GAET3|nr:hypothetical protein GGTG_06895 [Gaeumannomyces tritici R3-111a-1]EJT76981.1 hypothetical protein GGTG_06895 [Gaeumannomyces tritici R3-111a-1]